MIQIVEGDILSSNEHIVAQQVNCRGVMGAGLAKQIRNKYPIVYDEYNNLCNRFSNKNNLLGQVQFIKVDRNQIVANIFGQLDFGRGKVYTDYDALRKGLLEIKEQASVLDYSVAIPYGIGCGLAGGNWEFVYKMIDEVFADYEVTIYRL